MTNSTLSGDDARFYDENGYLHVKQLVSPEEAAFYRDELHALDKRIGTSGRRSGHALRAEIRAAAAEVRSQQRRVNRERRAPTRGDTLGALRVELRVFSADILAAARRADADKASVGRVLQVLDDARAAALSALTSSGS